ncbi:MAG: SDR family oxidoreductase [Pseudomonadota bacterium]
MGPCTVDNRFSETLFAGRTIAITGAGRGIGLAVARAFADCGATVIAHSGRKGTQKNLEDVAQHVFEADFAQDQDIAEFVASVKAVTPRLDVLINNAGTMLGRFPAASLTDEQYDNLVMLNQTSVVKITRGLLPLLEQSGDGAIVNTVSISANTGGSPGSSIYSATKAFVATYTKALARELAPSGIRANAVSPGTITTDFHDRYSTSEKLEGTRKSIPLQRLGTPEDCAPAYLFLASPDLSGYITGQVLEVNGGQLIK